MAEMANRNRKIISRAFTAISSSWLPGSTFGRQPRRNNLSTGITFFAILRINDADYISITDIAKYKTNDTSAVIANWMRNRNTIEFLGIWETLYNPDFKPLEFEGFKKEAGLNAFTLSPLKWITATNAIGFIAKSGRYGGTFAHKDIAFKFAGGGTLARVVDLASFCG